MKPRYTLIVGLLGTMIALAQPFDTYSPVLAQTADEIKLKREAAVHQTARNTTVLIQNINDSENFGSGVIIAEQDNTYTVLTTSHVLARNAQYTVTIQDKFQYRIKNIQRLPNVDLARFQFESREDFDIAPLGDFEQVREADTVHVAGYPTPGLNIQSPVFFIMPGKVTTILPEVGQNGYGIAYSNFTRSGMSGGPVFNQYGHVIAIHGRQESNADSSMPDQWVNLGIPIALYQHGIDRFHHQPFHPIHPWTHRRHPWVRYGFNEFGYPYVIPGYDYPVFDEYRHVPERDSKPKPAKPARSPVQLTPGAKAVQTILRQARPKTSTQPVQKVRSQLQLMPKAKSAQDILRQARPTSQQQPMQTVQPPAKPALGAKSAQDILRQARPKLR